MSGITKNISEPQGQVFLHGQQAGFMATGQPLVILLHVCEAGATGMLGAQGAAHGSLLTACRTRMWNDANWWKWSVVSGSTYTKDTEEGVQIMMDYDKRWKGHYVYYYTANSQVQYSRQEQKISSVQEI